jgi:uncharacterized membrane protein YfhO
LVFRAVRITPGEHRIEMDYQPQSFRNGTIVSVLAMLLVGALVVQSYRLRW